MLTAMAVIGVVALTITLLSPSHPAPKRARTAGPAQSLKATLRQLLATRGQLLNPAPSACPVAPGGCSSDPCVIFVASGRPASLPLAGIQMGTPFGSQGCALPQTFRAGALAGPQAVPVSLPVLAASSTR